jgi:hypothetical protein
MDYSGASNEVLGLDTMYVELSVVLRMGRITIYAGGSVSDSLRPKDLLEHVSLTNRLGKWQRGT